MLQMQNRRGWGIFLNREATKVEAELLNMSRHSVKEYVWSIKPKQAIAYLSACTFNTPPKKDINNNKNQQQQQQINE